jgi:hypothetical protein
MPSWRAYPLHQSASTEFGPFFTASCSISPDVAEMLLAKPTAIQSGMPAFE